MTQPRSHPVPAPAGIDGRWVGDRLTLTAAALASEVLAELPDRLAHSRLAGRQARRLAGTVPPEDRDLLVAAALLHDIGYAPPLRNTDFHPLDGARHLAATAAPPRLAALVAHHSEARLLAEPRGLLAELKEFEREASPVSDALTYADMTAGPSGESMAVEDRLRDIEVRHRHEDAELLAARRARVPRLLAAADRVRHRLAAAGGAAERAGEDAERQPTASASPGGSEYRAQRRA